MSPDLEPRLTIDPKYKADLAKLADLLRQKPFDLHKAADALDAWITNTIVRTPLVDLPALAIPLAIRPKTLKLLNFRNFLDRRPNGRDLDPTCARMFVSSTNVQEARRADPVTP